MSLNISRGDQTTSEKVGDDLIQFFPHSFVQGDDDITDNFNLLYQHKKQYLILESQGKLFGADDSQVKSWKKNWVATGYFK